MLEVDGLVLGVDVPPGPHEITWRYRPAWLTPTLAVGALATLVTIAFALSRPARRTDPQSSGANTITDCPP